VLPEIDMRPGETQFWQILNADYATYFRLALAGQSMTIVEQDGSMSWWTEEVDNLFMAPGNRFGVLVTAPSEPGVYPLEQLGFYQGPFGDARPSTVATVRVQGARAESVSLSGKLGEPPAYLAQKPDRHRVLTLSQMTGPNIPPKFMIDGVAYDDFTMNDLLTVKLGAVEQWVIRNASSPLVGQSAESHPFHIHVNDFVVTERGKWNPSTGEILDRKRQNPRRSQDTASVPPNEYMVFRTKFADFTGRSVYHCHILPHEDLGMMGAFDIVDADGVGAGSGQHLHGHMSM
jgi:suppressor of ftsI